MLIHPLRRNRSDPCRLDGAWHPPCVTPRGSRISATHASKTSTLRRLSGERRMRLLVPPTHRPAATTMSCCPTATSWMYGQSLVCTATSRSTATESPVRARGWIGQMHAPPAHRCHRVGRLAPGLHQHSGQSYAASSPATGQFSKVTQGITTEILGEGTTRRPRTPGRWLSGRRNDTAAARLIPTFQGAHGFDRFMTDMGRHGNLRERRILCRSCGRSARMAGRRYRRCYAGKLDTMRAATRRAMQGRRVWPRERPDISPWQLCLN